MAKGKGVTKKLCLNATLKITPTGKGLAPAIKVMRRATKKRGAPKKKKKYFAMRPKKKKK